MAKVFITVEITIRRSYTFEPPKIPFMGVLENLAFLPAVEEFPDLSRVRVVDFEIHDEKGEST